MTVQQDTIHGYDVDAGFVKEAPRRVPVVGEYDVVVIGAGPAGVGAGLAAAREGLRTLVVERHGMLGGMWTAGLMNPFFEHERGWIVADLTSRLEARGAWKLWRKCDRVFDTEAMKFVLEEMMIEAGAEFWYYSYFVDSIVVENRVRGVILEGKSGREAVLAKAVIDCSGDGDVAARAGVPYEVGRPLDGLMQPMTLMFEVSGVDEFKPHPLLKKMKTAIAEHDLDFELPYGAHPHGTPAMIHMPRNDKADVQATHMYRLSALDSRDLTKATVDGRRQAHGMMEVFRKIPELDGIELEQTAASIGIRETRHMEGLYQLSNEDLMEGRFFDDAVTCCGFCCDIHEIYPDDPHAHRIPVKLYQIPYRCMVPKDVAGLLFAGRCISGTHEAHASYRVTGICMAMGQAAGLAAAMALGSSTEFAALDGAELRRALDARGVKFR